MPTYALQCSACGAAYEHIQSIKDRLPTRCAECQSEGLTQDFSGYRLSNGFAIVVGEPTTVGQQAERNARSMGGELAAKEAEKILGAKGLAKRDAPTPFWRESGSKPLDLSKVSDVSRYVATGEK